MRENNDGLNDVWSARMDKLRDIVTRSFNDPKPDDITVYHWRDDDGGLRIGEISTTWRHNKAVGGVSWMQGDVESGPIIYAAERYLLNCDVVPTRPQGWESNLDYAQEAERRLFYVLTGKWPEWVEKTSL